LKIKGKNPGLSRRRGNPAIITPQNASYTGQTLSRRRECKNRRNLSTLQIVRYQIRTDLYCHNVYCTCRTSE